nr:transposase DNA-binding-containing protein [Rhodoplanes sp.]
MRENPARDVSTTSVDREVAGCEFRDARLGKRFCTLLEQIGSNVGQSIAFVCQDWPNTPEYPRSDIVAVAGPKVRHHDAIQIRTVPQYGCAGLLDCRRLLAELKAFQVPSRPPGPETAVPRWSPRSPSNRSARSRSPALPHEYV